MVVKEFKSEDEKTGFSAGDLTAEGTIFKLFTIIKKQGKFADDDGNIKPFYSIEGKEYIDGEELDFQFTVGNPRLASMLSKALEGHSLKEDGKGVWIKACGDGQGFARHYKVFAADTYDEVRKCVWNPNKD